jgi:2-polyprenyl-3-methyl-5-hydroxy-6-metoxy-1,4-benzoquinol methylase
MSNINPICLLCHSDKVSVLSHAMCRCNACGYFFVVTSERERQQASFQVVTDAPVNEPQLQLLRKKYPKENHGKRKLYEDYAKQAVLWYGKDVSILDVGASGGFFLHEVEKLGAKKENLRTLEVDRTYQALTEEYFGYEGVITNIETYVPERQYHFITLFDVLEHVHKFWDALATMRDALTPDGRLLLKLPNARWAYTKYKVAMQCLDCHIRCRNISILNQGGISTTGTMSQSSDSRRLGLNLSRLCMSIHTKSSSAASIGYDSLGTSLMRYLVSISSQSS